ncbi:ATP synthase F1 subunit delta [Candidatus Peregrinibacteria bacterium]|nr:ATP synthase F1 subunit delta [Candidatus Peregrinibacteria bacterium]
MLNHKKKLIIPFAKALLAISRKNENSKRIFAELVSLKELFAEKDFQEALLRFSHLTLAEMHLVLEKTLGKHFAPEIFNFLSLLVAYDLILQFPKIVDAYQKFYFDSENISHLKIVSARVLPESEQTKIADQFSQKKYHQYYFSFEVDHHLIGGIQMYENDLLADYSVKNYLNHLRVTFLSFSYEN